MATYNEVVIMFVGFLVIMAILYVVVSLWEKYITQSGQKAEDRRRMSQLGEQQMTYSNNYFNKLTKQSNAEDNLPTRPCDNCGAALDPGDKFCAKCGEDISSWIEDSTR